MIARSISAAVLRLLREGRVEIVEDGRRRAFGPPSSELRATVRVRDPRFWTAVRSTAPLGELYAEGGWECDDLVTLVRIFAREMPRFDRARRPFVPLRSAFTRIPRNTRNRARGHIAAHYDLGNDLFALFLDETMTYSCAVFETPDTDLREAQEAKLELVCRKLELRSGDHLLEIGTGWGSLALYAAERYGCRVTTTTISAEQHEVALRRVREARLDGRVTVLRRDYRDLRGSFDKLVSIEMIEAVGWQYFDEYFRRCGGLLAADGLMLLQAIVIDDRAYEIEKASGSFIRELVFPGGCLPSVERIMRGLARHTELRVLDLEDITEHYAETVRRWRENFAVARERAEELGYDRRFRRLWDLYLAWCEGGFLERRIADVQLLLAGPGYRRRAPSRELGPVRRPVEAER